MNDHRLRIVIHPLHRTILFLLSLGFGVLLLDRCNSCLAGAMSSVSDIVTVMMPMQALIEKFPEPPLLDPETPPGLTHPLWRAADDVTNQVRFEWPLASYPVLSGDLFCTGCGVLINSRIMLVRVLMSNRVDAQRRQHQPEWPCLSATSMASADPWSGVAIFVITCWRAAESVPCGPGPILLSRYRNRETVDMERL